MKKTIILYILVMCTSLYGQNNYDELPNEIRKKCFKEWDKTEISYKKLDKNISECLSCLEKNKQTNTLEYETLKVNLLRMENKNDSALYELEKITQKIGIKHRKYASLKSRQSSVLMELNKKNEAIEVLRKTYVETNDEFILIELLALYNDSKQYEKTIEYNKTNFRNRKTFFLIAEAFFRKGDYSNAKQYINLFSNIPQTKEDILDACIYFFKGEIALNHPLLGGSSEINKYEYCEYFKKAHSILNTLNEDEKRIKFFFPAKYFNSIEKEINEKVVTCN